ncbi:MAG: hypothetical protein KatS3mg077_1831 [Candidatus Binatia bacterium]|nr:MAG: hypothetical protein KatS3mg077_1831 [Candidatus Binatia bacterium]
MIVSGSEGWASQAHASTREERSESSAGVPPGLMTHEVLLPSQYFAPISDRIVSPEQRLMLAILEDAVYTVLKHAGSRSRRARRLVREAERWIALSDRSWVFSFENICAVLGFDAEVLRARLRRLQLRGEREGSTGLAKVANQHRVVGRQHRVVLAPSIRRRLRAQQKARLARQGKFGV